MAEQRDVPLFRELDRAGIEAILARNHVGRIGYARDNHVVIEPVHYVFDDGWIYGRTSEGEKYEALGATAYQWWPVVFEVDEVEDMFRWRSVLVHGGFYVVPRAETAVWEHAVELLRRLVPDTFGPDDPVAFRTVVFRIAVREATGREAVPPE